MKEVILNLIGICIIVFGWALTLWLGLYVMLYGGIMAAVENWGINNSAVVWGIIRAMFFECSFLVAWFSTAIGAGLLHAVNNHKRYKGF